MTDKSTLTHNARGEFDLFKVAVGIMVSVVTAGIIFICTFVVSTQVGIAELNKDVAALRAWTVRVEAFQETLFTRKEADAAFHLRDTLLQALTERVDALEAKE